MLNAQQLNCNVNIPFILLILVLLTIQSLFALENGQKFENFNNIENTGATDNIGTVRTVNVDSDGTIGMTDTKRVTRSPNSDRIQEWRNQLSRRKFFFNLF